MGRDAPGEGWNEGAAARGGFGNFNAAQDFTHIFPYQLAFRGQGKPGLMRRYSGTERNYRIMFDNSENPYTTAPGTEYRWTSSRCLGGRTLHWARASDRMADYEFKAASRDGYGMDWAVSYAEMKSVLRSRGELHWRERSSRRIATISRRPFSTGDAAELRGKHFRCGMPQPGMAINTAPIGAIDGDAQQPAAVPLLRQLY